MYIYIYLILSTHTHTLSKVYKLIILYKLIYIELVNS